MPAQALEIVLSITIGGGTAVDVPCSQVKRVDLDLHPWGFEAEVLFYLQVEGATDALFTLFTGKGLVEAKLSIAAHLPEVGTPPPPIAVQGIGIEKWMGEVVAEEVPHAAIRFRRYRLRFVDPAQALWRQHFPCALFVEAKKMSEVVTAQKNAKIAITFDWPVLEEEHANIFLGLGAPGNEASFYDFLIWYCREHNGVFTYDPDANAYKLSAAKAADGTPTELPRDDVATLESRFPATPRWTTHVLNSCTLCSGDSEVTPPEDGLAVPGVRHDVLMRTTIPADVDARVALETARLAGPERELALELARLPTIAVGPGTRLSFGDRWSSDLFVKPDVCRVRDLVLRAQARSGRPSSDVQGDAVYDVTLTAALELATDAAVRLPPFRRPVYPAYVEGKIVSEGGEDTDENYKHYTDGKEYKVKVPLFDGKKVVVRFQPDYLPGHFYFSAYKDERVLLALHLHEVEIESFLEWRAGARTPADGFGNQLLVGWSATSNTSVLHRYADKKPVLSVLRTSSKDTELLVMKDGSLLLQTKEDE